MQSSNGHGETEAEANADGVWTISWICGRNVAGLVIVMITCFCAAVTAAAESRQWIEVAGDGRTFVKAKTGKTFHPWGFNYDHNTAGELLEEYWADRWSTVAGDFEEMKNLGANAVRVHLQYESFMDGPEDPNEAALNRLEKLVDVAEREGLYLNLTGLGSYHREDVPSWYEEMDEEARWATQARFWSAIARRFAGRPTVFCYDLMNEPVAPGGNRKKDTWLPGPGLNGKQFVQRISLDADGRKRTEVARAWIRRMTEAIRHHDDRHLITVGLVPWSLDRPGLQSGFVPENIVDLLDFISVHVYPERGKVDEALETLRGFDAGKPVVLEETFPLKTGMDEFRQFMYRSRDVATGWFGFYWGKPIAELTDPEDIGENLLRKWLVFFRDEGKKFRRAGDGRNEE